MGVSPIARHVDVVNLFDNFSELSYQKIPDANELPIARIPLWNRLLLVL